MISKKPDKSLINYLPFDSEIFGFGCGELVVKEELSTEALNEVLLQARERKIRHLCAKVPAAWVQVGNVLEGDGFLLKISSLDLTKKLEKKEDCLPDTITVFEANDPDRLVKITVDAFDSGTRFHCEPSFSLENVTRLHSRWVYNLLKNPNVTVLVSQDKSIINGYITVEMDLTSGNGNIGLFAVHKDSRNKGIGKRLLKAAVIFAASNCELLQVRTESVNYPALNVYCKCGFSISGAWHVFHRFE